MPPSTPKLFDYAIYHPYCSAHHYNRDYLSEKKVVNAPAALLMVICKQNTNNNIIICASGV